MVFRPSALNCYLSCSAKYYFQYVEKIRVPNAVACAFGTAAHNTLNVNFSQKLSTGSDKSLDEIKSIMSDNIDREFQSVDKKDLDAEPGLKDQGIDLIEKYHTEVAPSVHPVIVEKRIEVTFRNYDHSLSCQPDLLDSAYCLIDHKTSARAMSDVPENYNLQISAYTLALSAADISVKDTRINLMVHKKNPEIIPLKPVVDQNYFLSTMQLVGDAIEKGIFIPNRGSFICSSKYCKFSPYCQHKFGGTIK